MYAFGYAAIVGIASAPSLLKELCAQLRHFLLTPLLPLQSAARHPRDRQFFEVEDGAISAEEHGEFDIAGDIAGDIVITVFLIISDIIATVFLWYTMTAVWRVFIWVTRYLPAYFTKPGHVNKWARHFDKVHQLFILILGAQLLWDSAPDLRFSA
jgi:hypothetical protein